MQETLRATARERRGGCGSDRLIIALDVSTAAEARKLVAAVGEAGVFYKVGKQLFTAEGPQVVRDLTGAVAEAAKLGVDMLTVHASGGGKMLRAAVEAAKARPGMAVLAVTVLTSLDDEDLGKIGVRGHVLEQVMRLAAIALADACQGLVASAREAKPLRDEFRPIYGNDFLLVTPGVRPKGASVGDQARVVTPAEALAAGASHIVVGRPITGASDPAAAVREIVAEIG